MSSLSRRQFALMVGAGVAAGKPAQAQQGRLTAGEVVDRIKKNLGIPWNDSTYRDLFKIGGPGVPVAGICTTFGTNLNLIQRSVKAGLNMIITHEPTFWTDADVVAPGAPAGGTRCDAACQADPLYTLKLDYAIRNNIVVWRIHDHIHRMEPDGISVGLNRRLNWTQYRVDGNYSRWDIPPTKLGELAKYVAKILDTRSVRVIGDPNLRVVKVAFGRSLSSMAQAVDCIIASEGREYDTFEYVRDAVLSGVQKGAIYVSHEAHEDPGMEEFAQWLKPFVPEVPVQYISTTDEFWTV